MKSVSRRLFVFGIATLSLALRACSPVIVAPAPRPRPVVIAPMPPPPPPPAPAPVIIQPVIPVWAPPYTYVTEVHYYYFPDYRVYYNVYAHQYVYFNGFNWLHVAVLPGLPLYHGFDPYQSHLVVLDRYTNDPWARHSYYEQQYPTGYYNTRYAPRQSLSSGTMLRAYDENQQKPLFVDRNTNRVVPVDYTVRQDAPRTNAISGRAARNESIAPSRDARTVENAPVQTRDYRNQPRTTSSPPSQRTPDVPSQRAPETRPSQRMPIAQPSPYTQPVSRSTYPASTAPARTAQPRNIYSQDAVPSTAPGRQSNPRQQGTIQQRGTPSVRSDARQAAPSPAAPERESDRRRSR